MSRRGNVEVRHAEVPPRLRVVRAPAPDLAVRPDRALDLADDRRVVDHLVLVSRRRREEAEDVVSALSLRLGGGQRREQRVGLEVDGDLDVVLLAPGLRPRPEPRVVPRHEVRPLHDRQVAASQRPLIPQRAGERGRCRAADRDRSGCHAGAPQQLRPRQALCARASVGTTSLTSAPT